MAGVVLESYDELSEKRKKAQEEGKYPEHFSTGGYQMFEDKYLFQASGFKEQAERIAKTAAKHLKKKDLIEKYEKIFFDIIWKGWLSCSTPVLANTGTDRGMPVSCSGTVVEDSVEGFFESLTENASLTKYGFGTAAYLGDIRPRGSKISRGGKSSGVLPVMNMFRQMSIDVSQGGVRRGSIGNYLPIDHGDFWECVAELVDDTDSLNIGWCVTDSFIKKLQEGDEESHKRFKKALKAKMVTGKGYFFFPDKVNRHNPLMYKDKGLDVKTSQLCVAPETLVLTKSGYEAIQDLEGDSLEVWNGEEWSEVSVVKTGTDQPLLKVLTNAGFELSCTPYHKFYVAERNKVGVTKILEKRAKDLVKGDKLIKCDFPLIEGESNLQHAYANGFYSGDGCLTKQGKRIYLYGDKRKLKDHLGDIFKSWAVQENQDREYGHSDYLKDKFFVPSNNYSVESRINWLAGLLDSDGTVTRNVNAQSLQIASVNKNFLQEVQMMLQTLGVSSKVTFARSAGSYLLPANDGTGLNKEFECKEINRLLINQTGICKLTSLGLKTHRLYITDHTPNRECSHFVKVESVIDEGRVDDTYCFTEGKRGMAVFNGILTGQCSEITLFADKDHSFTCVLSSVNLAKYDEWKDTDLIYWSTIFLDCIASEFIERAKGIKWLEKAVRFTEKSRALGLGVAGFATYLQSKMIPFESFEAHMFNNNFFKEFKEKSDEASKWLASELGEPEWCKGYGVRNTHVRAIAPTKSTALLIGGVSEGINPDPAMVFTQSGAAGDIARVNPVLLNLMKEKGVYNKKTIQEVVDNKGSVQNVSWLTETEKKVFKTAFEIDQRVILRLASLRGRYLDQWQSLNLFFSAEEDPKYIAEIHKEAFEDEGIRALYYVYSKTGVVAAKDSCESCQ